MGSERDTTIVAGVVDALPLGVWVARAPGGEFVYANADFARIMGMSARDDVAVGEYSKPYAIHDRSGAPYPEEKLPFVQAIAKRDVVMVDDLVIHAPEGKVFVRAYARPVMEEQEITHVVIAFFDITREVLAEEAKKESEDRALHAERMQAIGTVAGGIAHDFNNLLAAIRILADLLRGDLSADERRGTLDALVSATDAASNLSRSLLSFAGHVRQQHEALDLDAVILRLGRMFGYAIDRRVAFSLELDSGAGVMGDASRIEQLVMNLIVNAEEALPEEGKEDARIVVRTRVDGDSCIIEVEDTGPGVPEQARNRVFEPYFSTKTRRESGFGLATVYGVVTGHGGEVMVTEGELGGALFRVRLPACALPEVAEPAPDEPPIERGRGCLLVIDDEEVLREATETALSTLGYRTLSAASGARGVEVYREHSDEIDAIILDMSMPGLSGRQTYLRLRELDTSVRVLLTTGHARDLETEALIELGVREFVEKPWSLQTLSAALVRVLRTP